MIEFREEPEGVERAPLGGAAPDGGVRGVDQGDEHRHGGGAERDDLVAEAGRDLAFVAGEVGDRAPCVAWPPV